MKSVDTRDLKSLARKGVPVQVRPRAPLLVFPFVFKSFGRPGSPAEKSSARIDLNLSSGLLRLDAATFRIAQLALRPSPGFRQTCHQLRIFLNMASIVRAEMAAT